MFRKYFDKQKAKKRADALIRSCDFGTPLRMKAVNIHRSYWPKTPYTKEDDDHEAGFIHGYASRESEVETYSGMADLSVDVRELRRENGKWDKLCGEAMQEMADLKKQIGVLKEENATLKLYRKPPQEREE